MNRECTDVAGLEVLGAPLDSDVDRDDIVREFANVSCGHAVGALAGGDQRFRIHAPRSVASPVPLGEGRAVTLGLMTPFGAATLAVAF